MNSSGIPVKVAVPWASGAGTSYVRTVPDASQIGTHPGYASFNDGFVPLNATPIASGGIPPYMQDTNGALLKITEIQQWQCAGGLFVWDSTFEGTISGYPKGALLMKSGFNGLWLNQVDGNATNPDSGGANWIDPLAGRLIGIQIFTAASGTYTPNPLAKNYRRRMVGGGGGGGGISTTTSTAVGAGAGGGAGAYCEDFGPVPGSPLAYTVGASGAAGSSSGGGGGNGGNTTMGTLTAGGGYGGGAPNTTPPFLIGNSTPSTASGANILNQPGQVPPVGIAISTSVVLSGAGSPSIFGGGGSAVQAGTAGNPGLAYGSGGSGGANAASASTGRAGGAGAAGVIICEEYA